MTRRQRPGGVPQIPPPCPGVRHTRLQLPVGPDLHVAHAGPAAGPVVLALHGWPQHWWMWRGLLPALAADGFHVLCPDLRGLGWSGSPVDRDFRKERLVEDACAVLDAFGASSAAVIGHDWGGWTGFLLARRHPERVSRLLAASIAAPWRNARPRLSDVAFSYQPLVATPGLGAALVRRPGFLAFLMRRASARSFEWPAQALETYTAVTASPSAALASSLYYRDFLTHELGAVRRDEGETLGMPVLQLVGTEDLVLSRVAPPPPGADWRLELMADCGHFLFDEQPDAALDRTRRFLAD